MHSNFGVLVKKVNPTIHEDETLIKTAVMLYILG
jgi:hypothetical protein